MPDSNVYIEGIALIPLLLFTDAIRKQRTGLCLLLQQFSEKSPAIFLHRTDKCEDLSISPEKVDNVFYVEVIKTICLNICLSNDERRLLALE